MSTASASAAPWRSNFLSHINDMKPPIFTLGTLHHSDTSFSGSQVTPRVRTVVFRGMWAELPVNPKNSAELNPATYNSDLPAFTTDARMEKVPELFNSATAGKPSQSGRGGPVEAMFWATETSTQWRLRGHTYVIGPDIDTAAAANVREALDTSIRRTDDTGDWSWSRELTAHFGNLSPMMRGSFRNPPPGAPLSEEPDEGLSLGQKVEDLQDEVARKNFRVVVIVPEEVDQVDLSDPEKGKRWNYKFVESHEGGSWEVTELWP